MVLSEHDRQRTCYSCLKIKFKIQHEAIRYDLQATDKHRILLAVLNNLEWTIGTGFWLATAHGIPQQL